MVLGPILDQQHPNFALDLRISFPCGSTHELLPWDLVTGSVKSSLKMFRVQVVAKVPVPHILNLPWLNVWSLSLLWFPRLSYTPRTSPFFLRLSALLYLLLIMGSCHFHGPPACCCFHSPGDSRAGFSRCGMLTSSVRGVWVPPAQGLGLSSFLPLTHNSCIYLWNMYDALTHTHFIS